MRLHLHLVECGSPAGQPGFLLRLRADFSATQPEPLSVQRSVAWGEYSEPHVLQRVHGRLLTRFEPSSVGMSRAFSTRLAGVLWRMDFKLALYSIGKHL